MLFINECFRKCREPKYLKIKRYQGIMSENFQKL